MTGMATCSVKRPPNILKARHSSGLFWLGDPMKAILLGVMMALMAGCAGYGKTELESDVVTGVEVKLLYEEYSAAVVAVRAHDWTEDERNQIEEVIAYLDGQRVFLGRLHERGGGTIAMTAFTACDLVNDITTSYRSGKALYVASLAENEQPNPTLKQFDDTAVSARDGILDICSRGDAVDSGRVVEYLGLALRVIAATKGVPIP